VGGGGTLKIPHPLPPPLNTLKHTGAGRETQSQEAEGTSSEEAPSLVAGSPSSSGNGPSGSTPSLIDSGGNPCSLNSSGPSSLASDSPRRGRGERVAGGGLAVTPGSHEWFRRARRSGEEAAGAGGGLGVEAVPQDAIVRGSSGALAEGEGRPAGGGSRLVGVVLAPVGWALRGAWHIGSSALRGLLSG